MRRRSKRTRLRPRPFILIGLFLSITIGIFYSPVTAIRKVRVEGAPINDRTRLTEIMQELRGVPCSRVNARSVESKALENPEIRSASLSRTPFGSAVLHIGRRIAVARIAGASQVGLTGDGVLFPSSLLPQGLPVVELPASYPKIGLTLGNGYRSVDVAQLASMVQDLPSKRPVRIDLDPGGRLCLNIDSGRVDLGGFNGLPAKISWLTKLLREKPNFFDTILTLNLVDIERPLYTDRTGVRNP